jgi:hypothetical protein
VACSVSSPPGDSAVVVIRPDEGSPEAFRFFVDERLAGPEPELRTIGTAEALPGVGADAHE